MKPLLPIECISSGKNVSYPCVQSQSVESRTKKLAEKIQARMQECGLSRQRFASLMAVQPSIVTRWLSGSHNFTVATLFDIEDKLGFSLVNTRVFGHAVTLNLSLSIESHVTKLTNPHELLHAIGLFQSCESVPAAQVIECRDGFNSSDIESYTSKYFFSK